MQTSELPAVTTIPNDAWFAVDTGTAVVKVSYDTLKAAINRSA